MELIEIVPNVSEGSAASVVGAIAGSLPAEGECWLLDVHRDESHHRSVLTAVARPEGVVAAALRLYRAATEKIDLNRHRGEHPRIGAVDVFPVVALADGSRSRAVELVHRVARAVAEACELPVFLYGDAARSPDRRDLLWLRKGGFELLAERMAAEDLVPDYGPQRPHKTAGATAIGARGFLIAYNVELLTADRSVAAGIARRVRASSGGLPEVRALPMELRPFGRTQVSMNLTNFRVTSLATAFDAVLFEARKRGVEVVRSEIVGLIPEAAAFPGMEERLKLDRPPGILEAKIREAGLAG